MKHSSYNKFLTCNKYRQGYTKIKQRSQLLRFVMVNNLLRKFCFILLSVVSYAHAEEDSVLGNILPTSILKHSRITDLWNYEITSIDNKVISISNVVISLLVLIIGIRLAKYLSAIIRKKMLGFFHLDVSASSAIEKFIYYLLIALIVVTALDISNIPLSGLTFIGGAIALGVGLGSQNMVNNFLSGIIIMIESPISVGDVIEIEGRIAVVVNIGARCVHLKTYDNIDLLVPNSQIIENNITNWTLEDNVIRVTANYFIDGDCSPQLTKDLMTQAITENHSIIQDYGSAVCLDKFDPCGMKFDIYFFISTDNAIDRKRILNDLNMRIHELLKENGIKFSYYKDMYGN